MAESIIVRKAKRKKRGREKKYREVFGRPACHAQTAAEDRDGWVGSQSGRASSSAAGSRRLADCVMIEGSQRDRRL